MSRNELIAKIETLQTLEALIEETKAEAETVRNSIKAEMEAADTEELSAGGYIVRWTSVLTTRFDTKSFKEKFGEEIYKAFTKQVSSRRFSVIFLESLSAGRMSPCGSTTQAAQTGPASGPRPTSSMPHSPSKPSASSYSHKKRLSVIAGPSPM